MLPVALAQSTSGGVVIPYVLTGFMDDVIFARNPRLLDVAAQLNEAQCTRSLGPGYKLCAVIPVAGRRTHGTTFRALKVTSRVATPGAESAAYDCVVRRALRGCSKWSEWCRD